jgi:Sulfatase
VPPMSRRQLLERGLHIAVLWALAVAQPLFDLLGRNPEFFALRGSQPRDIVAFALLVTFAVPLVVLAVEWVAGRLSEAVALAIHVVCVAVLVGAIALQAISLAGTVPALVLALVLGAAGAVAYVRLPAARGVLTVLGPAPIVFVVLFLVVSDVSDQVFPGSADVQAAHVRATAPVVLVIFDEFPVHSLMGADGRIDKRLYPNFARLAGDATWYRNTASVDQDTPYAVPAILDGRLPRQDRLPVAADHPQNIFSLFGGRYELHVREDATALCAPSLCADREDKPPWSDIAGAYAHELLPDAIEDRLESAADTEQAIQDTRLVPRESKRHRYVRLHYNLAHDRAGRFEEFVDGIEGGRQPRLHLIHILLPHVPYQYLPSGRFYRRSPTEALPGLDGRPGYSSRFVVEQAYQRHLLQVQATDRLLGELLDRLHEVGIYDRALVAVVADHGISFRLGHDRRLVRPGNVQDIAPVPFLLKAPGQKRGRISDRPLQTIDVLPTIADTLGVDIPWKVDGRSALAAPKPRRREIVAKKFKHTYPVDTPTYESAKRAALARKLRLFGGGIYAFGPRPDLIGRAVPGGGRSVVVDPGSGFIPAHVAGAIEHGQRGGGRTVAVAVNGRVVATGLTFTLEEADEEQYSVVVPERSFEEGANRIQVLVVEGDELEPV